MSDRAEWQPAPEHGEGWYLFQSSRKRSWSVATVWVTDETEMCLNVSGLEINVPIPDDGRWLYVGDRVSESWE